jgi:GNAT superfamily N-acetyltransferase
VTGADRDRPAALTLQFRPLDHLSSRAGFSCGEPVADRWFHERAHNLHGRHCRVWTVHEANFAQPCGFYALSFAVSRLNRRLVAFRGADRFPSLRLEWLAVRTDRQGLGIGSIVMGRVLETFRSQIEAAHLPAMTLVPINERAARFYRLMGFQVLDPFTQEMVLAAADVADFEP